MEYHTKDSFYIRVEKGRIEAYTMMELLDYFEESALPLVVAAYSVPNHETSERKILLKGERFTVTLESMAVETSEGIEQRMCCTTAAGDTVSGEGDALNTAMMVRGLVKQLYVGIKHKNRFMKVSS